MGALKSSDPRGGHSRIYWSMQDSMAWRALSFSSIALYMAMRRKLQSTNNGNIEATLTTLRHAGFNNPTTLAKALRELIAVGFIARTRDGGVKAGKKVCNLFRFTDVECYENPKLGISKTKATDDWAQFKTLAEANSAIEEAHKAIVGTRITPRKNTSVVQKLDERRTETGRITKLIRTDSVSGADSHKQKVLLDRRSKSAANPHPA